MNILTDKQINTVATLLEQEIPTKIKTAFLLDRASYAPETVHSFLVRKLQQDNVPCVLNSMIQANKTGIPLLEFNELDKHLTLRLEQLVNSIKSDTFIPGVPSKTKREVLDYLLGASEYTVAEYVDASPETIREVIDKMRQVLDDKIEDFEL